MSSAPAVVKWRYLGRHSAPKEPRTYGDLLEHGRPSGGCCTVCHQYIHSQLGRSLGTRANICVGCCKLKHTEVLGWVVRAERKIRRYIKRDRASVAAEPRFYAHLCECPEAWIHEALAKEGA